MGILQDELDRVISESCQDDALKRAVFRRAGRKHGIELTSEQLDALARAVESAEGSEVSIALPSVETGGTLVLTVDELNSAANEITDATSKGIEAAISASIEDMPPRVLESLYRDAPQALRVRRSEQRGFARRLRQRWHAGLDRLEMLIMIAHESGETFLRDLQKESSENVSAIHNSDVELLDVLVRLHVRACRTASEILCLLNAGFADGAIARWRSLHETAVVAVFIAQHQGDLPQRFLRHSAVERFRAARQYQQHCNSLGQSPIEQAEFDALELEYKKELSRYGTDFKGDYGWAAAVFRNSSPTFADIERNVDLDRWRPYYRMACHGVHSGSQSLLWCLAIPESSGPLLLAGASNAGLCDPGHCTAISLTMISTALLTARSNVDGLVSSTVMQLLTDDIGEAFDEAHSTLEKAIEKSE